MILMPKKNLVPFAMYCIEEGSMTIVESVRERLDLFKPEPDNVARRKDLLKFSLALWDKIKGADAQSANVVSSYGGKSYSRYGPDEKGALIVCFAWLGMPEMCEEVRKSMNGPIPLHVYKDLRVPIQQSGGIVRYRSFLADAVSGEEDIAHVHRGLLELVGSPGETGHHPKVVSWCQQMIKTKLSSYSPGKRVSSFEISTLLRMCGDFGSSMYAERYVAFCNKTRRTF